MQSNERRTPTNNDATDRQPRSEREADEDDSTAHAEESDNKQDDDVRAHSVVNVDDSTALAQANGKHIHSPPRVRQLIDQQKRSAAPTRTP